MPASLDPTTVSSAEKARKATRLLQPSRRKLTLPLARRSRKPGAWPLAKVNGEMIAEDKMIVDDYDKPANIIVELGKSQSPLSSPTTRSASSTPSPVPVVNALSPEPWNGKALNGCHSVKTTTCVPATPSTTHSIFAKGLSSHRISSTLAT
ncbi:hypothetical protein CVT24_012296 [Panaeolus cyanescens]|uniref:Uncharacterized protein n=1 Tax=Panaeolus cyanescens TaxID=181874 RepID=A0A409X124_9AGAR|nr:hypothetical protein CVT24_012296 [Panaeolus cyanescens]